MSLLVTTDGSTRSLAVLPHAVSFSHAFGLPLRLVRVAVPPADDEEEHEAQSPEAIEDSLREMLDREGVEGDVDAIVPRPGETVGQAIVRAADEAGAAVIAMHSRGSGLAHHVVGGSVAMSVLATAGRPLLVTGSRIAPAAFAGDFRLAITSDGSPAAHRAADAIAPLLTAAPSIAVTLIHVYGPRLGDESEEAARRACMEDLETMRDRLPANVSVDLRVPELGFPDKVGDAILRALTDRHAHAVAIATHGHSARYHLLLGSVALSVLAKASVPVLLVRAVSGEG